MYGAAAPASSRRRGVSVRAARGGGARSCGDAPRGSMPRSGRGQGQSRGTGAAQPIRFRAVRVGALARSLHNRFGVPCERDRRPSSCIVCVVAAGYTTTTRMTATSNGGVLLANESSFLSSVLSCLVLIYLLFSRTVARKGPVIHRVLVMVLYSVPKNTAGRLGCPSARHGATEVTKAPLRQFQSVITSSAAADCSAAMAYKPRRRQHLF